MLELVHLDMPEGRRWFWAIATRDPDAPIVLSPPFPHRDAGTMLAIEVLTWADYVHVRCGVDITAVA